MTTKTGEGTGMADNAQGFVRPTDVMSRLWAVVDEARTALQEAAPGTLAGLAKALASLGASGPTHLKAIRAATGVEDVDQETIENLLREATEHGESSADTARKILDLIAARDVARIVPVQDLKVIVGELHERPDIRGTLNWADAVLGDALQIPLSAAAEQMVIERDGLKQIVKQCERGFHTTGSCWGVVTIVRDLARMVLRGERYVPPEED